MKPESLKDFFFDLRLSGFVVGRNFS